MKIIGCIVCCFAILGLMSTAGNTTPIVYSGYDTGAKSSDPRPNSDAAASSFDAAVATLGLVSNLITFESAPVGPFNNLVVATGVNLTGKNVFGNNQSILNSQIDVPDSLYGYNVTSGGSNFASINGGTITFTFTDPIQTFGAYISGVQLPGETIMFDDGSSQSISIPNPGGNTTDVGGIVFIGFTDFGASISSVTINATGIFNSSPAGDIDGVDDVRFANGASSPIPEPATMLLLGSGLIGLAGYGRKKFIKK